MNLMHQQKEDDNQMNPNQQSSPPTSSLSSSSTVNGRERIVFNQVKRQGQSSESNSEAGFNCTRCGKVEFRNEEFSTIKLGDIFSNLTQFTSSSINSLNSNDASSTLCSDCFEGNRNGGHSSHTNLHENKMSHCMNINFNGSTSSRGGCGGTNGLSYNNEDGMIKLGLSLGTTDLVHGTSTIMQHHSYINVNSAASTASISLGSPHSNSNSSAATITNDSAGSGAGGGVSVIAANNLNNTPHAFIEGSLIDNNDGETMHHTQQHLYNQNNILHAGNLSSLDNPNNSYLTVLSSTRAPLDSKMAIPLLNHSQSESSVGIRSESGKFGVITSVLPPMSASTSTAMTNAVNKIDKPVQPEAPRVPCTLCKKTFKNNKMASLHLKRVHEKVNRFVCEICGVSFSYRGSLDSHLASHKPPEVTHDCPTCGQKFKEKSNLLKHIRHHTDSNPKKFLCTHCPSGFSKRVNLRYHIKRKHPEAATQVMNNNNNREFGLKDPLLQQHQSTPHETPPISSSSFSTGSTSGLESCPKTSFNGKDKPQGNFKCEHCGRGFLFKNNLKAHLRTHTRDKKYTCELCQKSFIYKESLKNHMLLHSNELPYLCDICGKKFRDRSNRRKHVKNVHKYMFVNGDINNPIKPGGGEVSSTLPTTALGNSNNLNPETATASSSGKKAKRSKKTTTGEIPPDKSSQSIIKGPRGSKKSKNNESQKSVIVSTSSGMDPDRKIIMSPSPIKNISSEEYNSLVPELLGGGNVSQYTNERNIIVKASSGVTSEQEHYSPGPPMQNVIVYHQPKTKGVEHLHPQQHYTQHHTPQLQASPPTSVISLQSHEQQQQQQQQQQHHQQQYYVSSRGYDSYHISAASTNPQQAFQQLDYISSSSGGSTSHQQQQQQEQQQQQPSRDLSGSDIKLFGSSPPPQYSAYTSTGPSVHPYGIHQQTHNPHHQQQQQQQPHPQQHYWVTSLQPETPYTSPMLINAPTSHPVPPGAVYVPSNVVDPETDPAGNVNGSGIGPNNGNNTNNTLLYKDDLSQFDFSYL